jgi:hypothetical protein
MLGGRIIAVDFGSLARHGYLLPTALHQADTGRFSLSSISRARNSRSDLKVRLMRAEASPDDEAWAAAYVGLALREARLFFLSTQGEQYGSHPIRWMLNIGIPSALDGHDVMADRFLRVARAGWRLSLEPLAPTIESARDALGRGVDDGAPPIELVPEVAAAVVGYAKSEQRRLGLHLIVDFGASTIDVCGFILHEMHGGQFNSQMIAFVQPYGLLSLHDALMRAASRQPPFDSWPTDLIGPLPDWRGTALPPGIRRAVEACEAEYVERCARRLVVRAVGALRREEPFRDEWRHGLPTFVAGGGAQARVAREVLEFAEKVCRDSFDFRKFQPVVSPLNTLADLNRVSGRLAVAHGLSFPKMNIPTFQPPGDWTPKPLPLSDWRSRFIDKDQV